MKKQFLFFVLVLCLGLIACGSDKTAKETVTEEDVEDIAEDFLEKQLAEAEASVEATVEEETVANEVEFELEEVTVDKEAVLAQKKEILKEQLKASPNLGKDCDSIIKEYEELVAQYLKGENEGAVLTKLAEWANDPLFNNCKKNPDYKDKFFELEEKMYADEEEDF